MIRPSGTQSDRMPRAAIIETLRDSASGSGNVTTSTASRAQAAATAPKARPVPCHAAAAPSRGPRNEPATAAEIAKPISSPRRSGGAERASQPTAAVQEHALPRPAANRVSTSGPNSFEKPKRTLEIAVRPRPKSSVGRRPRRAASAPLGSAATRTPAANAPVSTPTALFDRPSAAPYAGRSGERTAKNAVSTRTTAATSGMSRTRPFYPSRARRPRRPPPFDGAGPPWYDQPRVRADPTRRGP